MQDRPVERSDMPDDRFTQILERHIESLRSSLEMMEAGRLHTHEDGKDTTEQSMSDNRVWIAELEEALARHRMRNA